MGQAGSRSRTMLKQPGCLSVLQPAGKSAPAFLLSSLPHRLPRTNTNRAAPNPATLMRVVLPAAASCVTLTPSAT